MDFTWILELAKLSYKEILLVMCIALFILLGYFLKLYGERKINSHYDKKENEEEIDAHLFIVDKIDEAIERLSPSEKTLADKLERELDGLPLLTENPMFASIEWMKTIIKSSISTGNRGKDLILQEIGIKKLDAWSKHLYKLAEEIERRYNEHGNESDISNKLFDMNMRVFNDAFLEYNEFWKDNDAYTEDEKWCLDYVIPVINRHHQSNVNETMEAIRYFCESKYFNNCISKQSSVYFVYLGALNRFTSELCKAFNEINGDLKGRVFKGIKI